MGHKYIWYIYILQYIYANKSPKSCSSYKCHKICGSLKDILQEYLFSLVLLAKLYRGFSAPRSHDLRAVPNPDCIIELTGVVIIIIIIPSLGIPQNKKSEYLDTGPGINSFINDSNKTSVSNLWSKSYMYGFFSWKRIYKMERKDESTLPGSVRMLKCWVNFQRYLPCTGAIIEELQEPGQVFLLPETLRPFYKRTRFTHKNILLCKINSYHIERGVEGLHFLGKITTWFAQGLLSYFSQTLGIWTGIYF